MKKNYKQNEIFEERLNESLVQHISIEHVVVQGEVDVDIGDLVVRLEQEVLVRIHGVFEKSKHVLVAKEIVKKNIHLAISNFFHKRFGLVSLA